MGDGVLLLGDVSSQIGFGLPQLRPVLGQRGFLLIEHCLQRTGVDGEQQIVILDVVAFLEGNLGQDASDLGFDRDRGIGLDIADDLDVARHVAAADLGYRDWHVAAALLAALAAGSGGTATGTAV